jgi:DNA-binding transcriptional regulator GbsR (MarR family)
LDKLLTEAKEILIEGMGKVSSFWGFSRAMGQIYGLLYLSSEPLTLDEIAQQLGMSKGNVSLNTRSTERWGLIKRSNKKSDRKDYYEAEIDFWKVIKDILRERDKKEFDRALQAVSESLALVSQSKSLSPTGEAQFYRERLKHMQEFFNAIDRMAQAILALDKLRLSGLIKLGSDKD